MDAHEIARWDTYESPLSCKQHLSSMQNCIVHVSISVQLLSLNMPFTILQLLIKLLQSS